MKGTRKRRRRRERGGEKRFTLTLTQIAHQAIFSVLSQSRATVSQPPFAPNEISADASSASSIAVPILHA